MKEWTPKAELYDFGRPFSESQVIALFAALEEGNSDQSLRVYEPGCGTGRILVPLAKRYPTWKFVGLDSSVSSLSVCRQRCLNEGITNIEVHEGLVTDELPKSSFDIVIHSSVLHVIPSWQKVMAQLSDHLSNQGIFCLIGDYGDIYDAALGRDVKTGIDPALTEFWNHYLELRQHFGAPSAESSQIGCRWDLQSTDLAVWLEGKGFKEFKTVNTDWDEVFSASDLMRIVEERCYSSMFTVEKEIFDQIIMQLKVDLPRLRVTSARSRHQAAARFFTL